MNLASFISPRHTSQTKNSLVIIDARHSIYDYRPHTITPDNMNKIQYATPLKQFLVLLNDNADFLFCFFHKNQAKNELLAQAFTDFNTKNQLPCLEKNILITTRKNILTNIMQTIQPFVAEEIDPQLARQRSTSENFTKSLDHKNRKLKNILIVSHNPISIRIPTLLSQLNNHKLFVLQANFVFVLFSSYIMDISKKMLIETHFYKCNFLQTQSLMRSNYYFDHISSLNQVIPYFQHGLMMLKNIMARNIGYYFYPKKQSELILYGVLNSNNKVRMLPIDLRIYNIEQYEHLNVFFHKILDLNKKAEIKFSEDEITTMKKNYEKFIEEYKGRIANIDPLTSIPIISERVLFAEKFNEILSEPEFLQAIKNTSFKFKTPGQNTESSSKGHKYPVIVKSLKAAFTPNCHIMAIVVSDDGLRELIKLKDFRLLQFSKQILISEDIIIQDFINHDGLIYKIYCLGKTIITQKRASIPNITIQNFKFKEGYYVFDSQQNFVEAVKKCLIKVPENDYVTKELPHEPQLKQIISKLSEIISVHFELSLFGFDIIGDFKQMEFYVIDINHFPGYKNVAKIKELFDELFIQKCEV